jgi:hypothetical protein
VAGAIEALEVAPGVALRADERVDGLPTSPASNRSPLCVTTAVARSPRFSSAVTVRLNRKRTPRSWSRATQRSSQGCSPPSGYQ